MRLMVEVIREIKCSGPFTNDEVLEGEAGGLSGELGDLAKAVIKTVFRGGNFVTESLLLAVHPSINGRVTTFEVIIESPEPDKHRLRDIREDLEKYLREYYPAEGEDYGNGVKIGIKTKVFLSG